MNRNITSNSQTMLAGRLMICIVVVALVFVVFTLRLFQLQVIEASTLQRRADQNSVRTHRLDAARGVILDREGHILATTRPAFGLTIVPAEIEPWDYVIQALARLTGQEIEVLEAKAERGLKDAPHQSLSLIDDLSFDVLARIESHRYALPGVTTEVQPRRFYPSGELAAHVLGTIGQIGSDQLRQKRFAGYRAGDVIGQSGVEARFERLLRGRAGGQNVVVDATGRVVEILDQVTPIPGDRLVLTIDSGLQEIAEEAFKRSAGEESKSGAVLVLDVHAGDVLAMMSRPAYDPNAFSGGIDVKLWNTLTQNPWDPLQNRSLQNSYPPGSVHKAILSLALLEEGLVDDETKVFCPGHYRFGDRNYRCWKREGHGWVDLKRALKESCDVLFYEYGLKLGIDRISRYAKSFFLGKRIDLGIGQETSGVVPSPSWKQKQFGESWYAEETISTSIGQGYNLVTPMQLAIAYAAIANGGRILSPRLVLRLEDRDSTVLEETKPKSVGLIPISSTHVKKVVEALVSAVQEKNGTGIQARVEGVSVAGKTGTAQVVRLDRTDGMDDPDIPIRHRDHAWFVAFAPAENPEIVVVVFVEHGLHGGSVAAPIAQTILEYYFSSRPPVSKEVGKSKRIVEVAGN